MCSGNETANIYFWSHLLNQRNLELVTGLLHISGYSLGAMDSACMHKVCLYPCKRHSPRPPFLPPTGQTQVLVEWWRIHPALSPTQVILQFQTFIWASPGQIQNHSNALKCKCFLPSSPNTCSLDLTAWLAEKLRFRLAGQEQNGEVPSEVTRKTEFIQPSVCHRIKGCVRVQTRAR